jgi:colicin import membrane protein
MAEQKESSVLFSLKELMSLEENRIKEEEQERERRARAEAERRAREEAERRAAEEARLRAEEEARRVDEQRKREEATRLEAIRHGELEKAKAEAEHQARMQQLAAQQAHEQQLAALNRDQGKKRLQLIVGIVTAVLVVGIIGGALAWKKADDQRRMTEAAHLADQQRAEAELKRLKADFDEAQKKQEDLQTALANAKDEATRKALETQLAQAKADTERKQQATTSRGTGGGSRPGGDRPKKSSSNCAPGDPMCGDL